MTTKEFEKQTLDQLLIDLKDIDNYKSFRKGAFVYDLGYYQGQLLLKEINRLNNIIDEAIKYNKELCKIYDLGCIERSNADTNLIILQDKEHLEILKEINELKGDNK